MTLTDQQRAFDETRGRIQRNLDELATLSRSSMPPGGYFAQFLSLAVNSLDALGGAIWWKEGEELKRIAEVRFEASGYGADLQQRWIDQVLQRTLSARQPHIVAAADATAERHDPEPEEISNTVPHPFFYHPFVMGERAVGVIQIWLRHAGDPRTYNDIAAFVAQIGSQAENYLKGWHAVQLAGKNQQVQVMLRMQGEFVGELDPKILLSVATNYLVDLAGADIACAFQRKGRGWRLVTASNQEAVDARAVKSLSLSDLAAVLAEETEPGVVAAEGAEGTLKELMDSAGLNAITWHHLASSKGGRADLLLLAGKNDGGRFPEGVRQIVGWVTAQLARALESATHFHHLPLRPLVSAAGRASRAWKQNRRRKIVFFGILPAVVFVGLFFVPVPWKIAANCMVVPMRKATIVAEAHGKVVEVSVNEGDTVSAGQLLGKVDDTDFVTQMAISHQQLLRWQVEAGKAQALGNEAERKIAEIGSARELEALRRLEFLRSRTELRSPIDGVVLTRGLHNRKGEALEPGKPFCEVAGIGDELLQLEIKQGDLGDILGALESGRTLDVDFILHPHPLLSLTTALSGVSSLSQLPELRGQASVFLANAPFPKEAHLKDAIKPGFTGKAKILMGRRPLGIVLFRPFFNYLRTTWGV